MVYRNIKLSSIIVELRHVLPQTSKVYRLDEESSILESREVHLEVVGYLDSKLVDILEKLLETPLLRESRGQVSGCA
jgi:hypothetical protein